jgi:ribosomal protein S18 acetylase RimI-like enzyme
MDALTTRARAAHADAWEAQGRLRAPYGGGAAELRGIRLSAAGIAQPQWNNGDVTAADADIEGARAFFGARATPWGVRVPPELPWTRGRLLFRIRMMALPACAFEPAGPVAGLTLAAATSADLDTLTRLDAAAFGSNPEIGRRWTEPLLGAPAATVALATHAGLPVATGYSLRTNGRAGPCLYVAAIAVAHAARRRGIGSAVTSWLLERGFAAGAELAHLHPDTDAAARIYARLGFTETAGLDVYVDL